MKTLILFSFLLSSFSLWATDYPICTREAKIAKFQHMAKELSDIQTESILKAQSELDRRRIQRARERELACPCDNDNPGLQALLLFIESDFSKVQTQLLAQASAHEVQGNRVAARVLRECQTREHKLHQDLLAEAQLSY